MHADPRLFILSNRLRGTAQFPGHSSLLSLRHYPGGAGATRCRVPPSLPPSRSGSATSTKSSTLVVPKERLMRLHYWVTVMRRASATKSCGQSSGCDAADIISHPSLHRRHVSVGVAGKPGTLCCVCSLPSPHSVCVRDIATPLSSPQRLGAFSNKTSSGSVHALHTCSSELFLI